MSPEAPEGAVARALPRWQPSASDLLVLWRSSVRFSLAFVVAAFPFIFLFDEAIDFGVSPVLPGILVLILCMLGLPFGLAELRARKLRRLRATQEKRLARAGQSSWALLGLAVVWFVLWLAVGP